jgi:NDP-sugar pyrophosphorylase family protein
MGVYCMEPGVIKYIPPGMPFGLDDLAHCLLEKGVPIHVYKHEGLWLDVGRVEDFHNAQEIKWEEQAPSIVAMAG